MNKFFSIFAILLLLASSSAMAQSTDILVGNVAEEEITDFGTDSYDEDGCYL